MLQKNNWSYKKIIDATEKKLMVKAPELMDKARGLVIIAPELLVQQSN